MQQPPLRRHELDGVEGNAPHWDVDGVDAVLPEGVHIADDSTGDIPKVDVLCIEWR